MLIFQSPLLLPLLPPLPLLLLLLRVGHQKRLLARAPVPARWARKLWHQGLLWTFLLLQMLFLSTRHRKRESPLAAGGLHQCRQPQMMENERRLHSPAQSLPRGVPGVQLTT